MRGPQFIPTHGYNKRSLVPRHLPGVSTLTDFSDLPMVLSIRCDRANDVTVQQYPVIRGDDGLYQEPLPMTRPPRHYPA